MFRPRQIEKFHIIAAEALATGEADYNAKRRFRNFRAVLQDHKDDPCFLELFIMSGLFAQESHYLVRRSLVRLRNIRGQQGRPELFAEFDALLLANKQGILVNNHGYGTRTLANVDKADFYKAVQASIADVTELGYQVSANSGTLLGLIRDKGLIAFDDDVDLFVFLHAGSHKAAAEEMRTLGQKLHEKGHGEALRRTRNGVIKLKKVEGFDVDLLPAYQIGQEIYIYPYSFGDLESKDVFPLSTCELSGFQLPQDPEKVLAVNYGRGWRVPDPRYAFPWERQNKLFHAFLHASEELSQ